MSSPSGLRVMVGIFTCVIKVSEFLKEGWNGIRSYLRLGICVSLCIMLSNVSPGRHRRIRQMGIQDCSRDTIDFEQLYRMTLSSSELDRYQIEV